MSFLIALFVVVYFGRLISFLSTHSNSAKNKMKYNRIKQNKGKIITEMQNVYFAKFEDVILIPLLHLPKVNVKTRSENSQQILENIGYGLGVTP